jgi:hypothetical protein
VGKKARTKPTPATATAIAPRQPCPCGSGRRYKACHGRADGSAAYVLRTFAGLPAECDWIALREFVPAATARLQVRADAYDGLAAGRTVTVTTVLPGIAAAMVRADSEIRLAVQVAQQSADLSRDFAEALGQALRAAPGESVVLSDLPGAGVRLQDVVAPDADFAVQVLDGFDFWFDEADGPDASVSATLENLNASIDPTRRLDSVEAAYWVSTGTREHLRWVQPFDEEQALSALARLHVADSDSLGPGSRLVGSFRAHGLLVPVWDLPVGTGADALEEPAAAFAVRLQDALSDTSALTVEQRSARSGLANRQITIR